MNFESFYKQYNFDAVVFNRERMCKDFWEAGLEQAMCVEIWNEAYNEGKKEGLSEGYDKCLKFQDDCEKHIDAYEKLKNITEPSNN